MATYKDIHGTNIEVVSSDPSNPVEGQVWYNSSSGALKGASVTTAGAWSSGGNLNTGRSHFQGGGGSSSDAALACGGLPATAKTEAYNGSSWTEVADLNTARYGTSSGTYTSVLTTGGGGSVASSSI